MTSPPDDYVNCASGERYEDSVLDGIDSLGV
jgi:hypothetical protein